MTFNEVAFNLLGGLALFLFGMKTMSNGLKKVAGSRLKGILAALTQKPIVGLLMGAGVTCLIQSSSATTIMVIGFVNAGLLTLKQAISVVLGANIGTTFTAWLVSFMAIFKVTHYALPAIALGYGLQMLGRTQRSREWGQCVFGFGVLFVGIGLMKDAFDPVREDPHIQQLFITLGHQPIFGLLAGAVVTMILQSSSATVAMVQLLALNGLIDFPTTIPIILGDNIGTTITAQIAAVGANRTAKRAAMAHTLFNVIGACYMLVPVYMGLYHKAIEFLVPGELTQENVMFHIAVSHSAFNVFNALLFLPFVNVLAKISTRLLPPREETLLGEVEPRYLEKRLLDTPPVALEEARNEIVSMAKLAQSAVAHAVLGFFAKDGKILNKVGDEEDSIDFFQEEITRYLIELSQRNLTREESEELPVLLHSVNDLERVGDHAENVVELGRRMIEGNLDLSSQARKELEHIWSETNNMLDGIVRAVQSKDHNEAKKILKHEEEVNRLRREFRASHEQRVHDRVCDLRAGLLFIDFVDNMEKMGDHLTNIAQAVMVGLRYDGQSVK